jgi:hypothetical protein
VNASPNEDIQTDGALSVSQRETLDAVLDCIVPPSAERRLPGASEVGVPAYLAERAADALPGVRQELDELDRHARERHALSFAALDGIRKQSLVDDVRAREPAFMSRLALETVSCYYQHDLVLEALGMEARPPYPKGYEVLRGDLGLLEPVRRLGRLYRDA